MKVIVLGAAGRTGVHLVEQALAKGYTVTAFVRPGETVAADNQQITIKEGDAKNIQDLKTALIGQDAVVSALGSNKLGDNLIAKSTGTLIDAMRQTGVKRVIMMSSFVVTPNFKQSFVASIVRWLMNSVVKDKSSGEDLLKQSNLDWTIVYATRLDGVAHGPYRIVGPNEKSHHTKRHRPRRRRRIHPRAARKPICQQKIFLSNRHVTSQLVSCAKRPRNNANSLPARSSQGACP